MRPEFIIWAGDELATLLRLGIAGGVLILAFAFVGCGVCDDADNAAFAKACELAKAQPQIRRRKKVVRNVRRENHAGLL